MARIVVVTHAYDNFFYPRRFWRRRDSNYLLFKVLRMVEQHGHRWRVAVGPRPVPGDVGILHVDSTMVDAEYRDLARHYGTTINFGAGDISKRNVSGALLTRDDPWGGPVIVKTNRNYGGRIEADHNARALAVGRPPPHADLPPVTSYPVLPSRDAVAPAVWDDPALVVERFIPERDETGYGMRTWVFMGRHERCTRHVSTDPVIKAGASISRTPAEIPEALRAERARLGFDYGKFDFVVHEGRPLLLDANRTPGQPPATGAHLKRRVAQLADGLLEIVAAAR